MLVLGYILRLVKVFNDGFLEQLNNLAFKVFLPLLLFVNVYESDFESIFSIKLVLYALACVAVCFFILLFIVPIFCKDNKRKGVIVQGAFRSNFILFGLPIATSIFGAEGGAVTSILVAFVVPLLNALSVLALSFYSEEKNYKKILVDIVKNPFIVASIISFAFILLKIKLPPILETTIDDIAKVATPLSIIILGGSFAFSQLSKNALALTMTVSIKLVLYPAIFTAISVLLGFRGVELVALFAMFSSPTAVSSFNMAQSMGCDHELAGQVVVTASIFSILSIFVGILLLSNFGLI